MADTLFMLFPDARDFLALEPEELGGVLIELIPGVSQSSGFTLEVFTSQLFKSNGPSYAPGVSAQVVNALGEAIAWLMTQGIIMRNPNQPAAWYILTRRGAKLKNRTDLENYRKGRTLPVELLQPHLAEKTHHLFLRGDHDVAVVQGFKVLEVAVRRASGLHDLHGRDLMQQAFKPETGPLSNSAVNKEEQQAEMFLFSGALGHARNPMIHRDIDVSREEAARLLMLASYLLAIVEKRSP